MCAQFSCTYDCQSTSYIHWPQHLNSLHANNSVSMSLDVHKLVLHVLPTSVSMVDEDTLSVPSKYSIWNESLYGHLHFKLV